MSTSYTRGPGDPLTMRFSTIWRSSEQTWREADDKNQCAGGRWGDGEMLSSPLCGALEKQKRPRFPQQETKPPPL